jgi:hypothetical protein
MGSGVSSSGDAAVPAARFLTLITILFEGKGGDLKWTNVRVLSRLFDQRIYWSQQQGLVYPAAMRLGAIGFGCGSFWENASSAPAAHIPGQKVEVPIKVRLGTSSGRLFVLTPRDLIETPSCLESDRR